MEVKKYVYTSLYHLIQIKTDRPWTNTSCHKDIKHIPYKTVKSDKADVWLATTVICKNKPIWTDTEKIIGKLEKISVKTGYTTSYIKSELTETNRFKISLSGTTDM